MGKMGKYLKIMLISLLVASILLVSPVGAELEKPVFEKGDYWVYDVTLYNYYENGTQYIEGLGTLRSEVIKKDKITINGKNYNVVVLNETRIIDYIDGERESSVITRYLDEDSLAVLMEVEKNAGTWQVTEATYDPPILYYNYPLFAGKNWSIDSNATFSPYGNTTRYIAFCECIGKQNITTKAGKFENCYVVKIVEPYYLSNDTYLSYYFAAIHPDAYICFFEQYLPNQTGENVLRISANLTSYSYSPGEESEKTPDFEIATAILSLVMIYLFSRKRK